MTAASDKRFLSSSERDPAFISKNFTNWKEPTKDIKQVLAIGRLI